MNFCSFCVKLFLRARDKKGRVHILQISLDGTYPNHPPSISTDVPYRFNLKWSINSRLKDIIQQFQKVMNATSYFLLMLMIRHLYQNSAVESLRVMWRKNCNRWYLNCCF